ncbi:lipase family protein [Corynebacterium pseudopelargi]|uniref:Putative inactive lipase n=1 Tax=Corynebacterium pseudopelargi TaxID=2080757 RepID=A0A3G6IXC7_9CORY|nr:lipase family protein [Corynebacterium pseudopelargi]AZA10307.1 putative inactive lipase [Corynebacterium pseudopelargi]
MQCRTFAIGLGLVTALAMLPTAYAQPADSISEHQIPLGQGALMGSVPGSPLGGSSIERDAHVGERFYDFNGDLSAFEPGDVIRSRTLPYHVLGVPTPLRVVQLLYKTSDAFGAPQANVTSIAIPNNFNGSMVSYHSVYDSLNPEHSPSRAIAGNVSLGTAPVWAETAFFANLLTQGYAVALPDIEGPEARFAVGPEYGRVTLDSLRAAMRSGELAPDVQIAMMGYSGGSIATSWAAAMAPEFAPDVNEHLIGAAMGGVLVAPANNIKYIDGSPVWAGISAMTIVGVSRSIPGFDLTPYLNDYGIRILESVNRASIAEVEGQYGGLRWVDMAKPEYQNPFSIPEFVGAVNSLNIGLQPNPSIPLQIWQSNGGIVEGTIPGEQGLGDGVMLENDVRGLATKYCQAGVTVEYITDPSISHTPGIAKWALVANQWIQPRLEGKAAPNNCGTYPAGTVFAPVEVEPQAQPVDPGPAQGSAALRFA